MIAKAKVLTNSADDEKGRVKVYSPCLWEESLLLPVFNQVPLNVDDIVYVWSEDDYATSLILGKCRDDSFKTNSSQPSFAVLFESVKEDTWTVGATLGDSIVIDNSEGTSISITKGVVDITGADGATFKMEGDTITMNGGGKKGLVLIDGLFDYLKSIQSKFNAHTHVVTAMAGNAAITSAVTTSTLAAPTRSKLENDKISQ